MEEVPSGSVMGRARDRASVESQENMQDICVCMCVCVCVCSHAQMLMHVMCI